MWHAIFRFELKNHFRKPSTYIYCLIFLAFGLLTMLLAAGGIPGASATLGGSNKVLANAPYALSMYINMMAMFGMLIVAPIMGQAVCKDFNTGVWPLFFTKPVTRASYLGGRYLAAFAILTFIFLSMALGLWLGTHMPTVEPSFLGPNKLISYLAPYMTIVIPNTLFLGSIFFALSSLRRKMFPTYIAGVVLVIGYMIAARLTAEADNKTLMALLDPFGMRAVSRFTEYWSVAEQNQNLVPLSGVILYNRILWGLLGAGLLSFTWWRFSFSHQDAGRKAKAVEEKPSQTKAGSRTLVHQNFGMGPALGLFRKLAWLEFKQIVKNVYFVVIMLAAILFVVITAPEIGKSYGATTYPVTYMAAEAVSGSFGLFFLIVITFYAGELVWRERNAGMNQIFDALPLPDWVVFFSKLAALAGVQFVLMGLVLLCSVISQTLMGYTNYEFGLYFKLLFLDNMSTYLMLVGLAMFIQVLVNHKYLGHFLVVLFYFSELPMNLLHLDHNLYRFAESPDMTYSDMNGFSHVATAVIWFKLYWGAFTIILAALSGLFWVRGMETHLGIRARLARMRMKIGYKLALGAAAIAWLGVGGFIFYNTNILNDYVTSKDGENQSAAYERQYKEYAAKPIPRIVGVYAEVDIHPEERDLFIKGRYRMVNKNDVPVDQIIVSINSIMDIREMKTGIPSTLQVEDKALGFYVYQLDRPLQPGEETELTFELAYVTRGFKNNGSLMQLVANGSFFNQRMVMPSLGYLSDFELSDDRQRMKQGLPEKPRMRDINDREGWNNSYLGDDADWVDFEAVVSTSPDQIALAPGYLQREWEENGRRYFHYKMDSKILNFFSFISARYEVERDRWNDIPIEIYYQKGHEYNLDRMIKSVKRSLDYYTANFSPYQHRQVRIIEFPRYAGFAQSFPNTIPYSESIGFITKVEPDDPEDIDLPFYVTAHEMAHQWWAHQVIGANVQGATVMSETLSQYSALMVMEKEYGADKMKRFLKHELHAYLLGRSIENKKENPLILNENQGYIHYRKGSLVMYALKDYIGEEAVNAAIRNFLEPNAFKSAPFPTALEFLECVKAQTPPEMLSMVEDLFEHITLYDNRAIKASSRKMDNGEFEVTLETTTRKFRADELGNEEAIAFNDFIDIGVMDKEGNLLYLEKHRLSEEENKITLLVSGEPRKAGIDPLNKLIDRAPDNNTVSIEPSP